MNKTIRAFFVDILALTLGEFLVLIRPKRSKELAEKGITVVLEDDDLTRFDRLMRRAILRKVERKGDLNQLSNLHKTYWSKKGAEFFAKNDKKLKNDHLPYCEFIFDLLQEKLNNSPITYDTLVEIGTGNGLTLHYLKSKLTKVNKFIGLDLSQEQIDSNTKKYSNETNLRFIACDAFDYIKKNSTENTIYLTFMGVFEYFTEDRLLKMFKKMSASDNVMIIAIEPVALEHDFDEHPNSMVYGTERSFSHNYKKLLALSNFELWHYSKKEDDENRESICFFCATNQRQSTL